MMHLAAWTRYVNNRAHFELPGRSISRRSRAPPAHLGNGRLGEQFKQVRGWGALKMSLCG